MGAGCFQALSPSQLKLLRADTSNQHFVRADPYNPRLTLPEPCMLGIGKALQKVCAIERRALFVSTPSCTVWVKGGHC